MSAPTAPLDVAGGSGPLDLVAAKPFSLVYRSADGTAYVKVYRAIDPGVRRDREIEGLRLAAWFGVSAPTLLRTGEATVGPWIEVSAVSGRPCGIDTPRALTHYLDQVLTTTGLVHRPVETVPTGYHRTRLLSQLTHRCWKLSWWPMLHAALADVDSAPCVHLHGDLKPDHLFVHGSQLSVIDWENSTAGPAAQDYADAAFHLVRDLLLAGTSPRDIPVQAIGQLPVTGSALAWRIALWLDRRRRTDITLLTVDDLDALTRTATAEASIRACATVVAGLLSGGVPR
ncbi:phosphotransferase [Streptomyces sp. NBC_01396]|uniref:phosphotransferase n=1 Tax=Streptomyces sp. NBC_01396 TaxID=2903852 RepID=UPI00324C7F9D